MRKIEGRCFAEMEELACREIDEILNDAVNIFLHLMGKHPPNVSFDVMYEFWVLAASHISNVQECNYRPITCI